MVKVVVPQDQLLIDQPVAITVLKYSAEHGLEKGLDPSKRIYTLIDGIEMEYSQLQKFNARKGMEITLIQDDANGGSAEKVSPKAGVSSQEDVTFLIVISELDENKISMEELAKTIGEGILEIPSTDIKMKNIIPYFECMKPGKFPMTLKLDITTMKSFSPGELSGLIFFKLDEIQNERFDYITFRYLLYCPPEK